MSNPVALVIEDDRDLANLFAIALRMAGVETEIVHAGDTALARLAVLVPDLVVLDLHIPRTAGIDVLRQIRADARLSGTRVVVVTGDLLAAKDIQNQADQVLIKPFSFDDLQDLATGLTQIGPPDE
ncbi:MAG TPA: response regulator [Anaerolineae bacterium]|jgi:DNA-binding response OmpR family regulator|nr:response regulator [Anaerolineae bacterium]